MARKRSFGQDGAPTALDRLGRWLSTRRFRKSLKGVSVSSAVDVGCGYDAKLGRQLFVGADLVLVDVNVDATLAAPNVKILEGQLPSILSELDDHVFDVVLCHNVLEHLWEPETALREFVRITRPGGLCLLNVPSWLGKRALEFSAFRLGTSPRVEMNDHKNYYDPKDLWPLLIRAGFAPSDVHCRRHKLGLNTIAVCQRAGL